MRRVLLLALLVATSLAKVQEINSFSGGDEECPINIPGIKHHGNCKLFCRPASWIDIVVFYLSNYIAHAATITTRPGQSILSTLISVLSALLFPGAGVRLGVQAIFSCAVVAETDLQVAARAGALCAVVNTHDALRGPQPDGHAGNGGHPGRVEESEPLIGGDGGEESEPLIGGDGCVETEETPAGQGQPFLQPRQESPKFMSTRIHGLCQLPDGYDLVVVPRTAKFERDDRAAEPQLPLHQRVWGMLRAQFLEKDARRTVLCCNYNVVKIFVSLAQLGFTVSTLYRTQGDQIKLYGYAAFGLTVAPYAWMSFVNLAGNLLCPQYNTMFVVESSGLDHLREEIARDKAAREVAGERPAGDNFMVTGTVGRLTRDAEVDVDAAFRTYYERGWVLNNFEPDFDDFRQFAALISSFYVAAVPIAIVGKLSGFSPGQSLPYQRVWTMMWLVFGVITGFITGSFADLIEGRPILGSTRHEHLSFFFWYFILGMIVIYGVLPIGGYRVVAQMITKFGVCYEFKNVGSGTHGSKHSWYSQ